MPRTRMKLGVVAVAGLVGLLAAALVTGGSAVAGVRRGLVAQMKDATGSTVGSVRLVPQRDGKVLVRAKASGLSPGFHGFHVHTTGVCDPEAQDTNGNPVPFFSAGGHYNPATASIHGAHAGDMPPLLALTDGMAILRFKTDRFKNRELLDSDGSAIIMHAGPDNLAHIPAAAAPDVERYHSHVDDVFGPDAATRATGDAGARFACGVLKRVKS